ncbi:hypothetical protein [Algirhabdus cladophorae]|uniref:hypothetical protein n=1 Tax=Algirhabdus cladophorae TaxID=3377108 RepID=UPI003B847FE0
MGRTGGYQPSLFCTAAALLMAWPSLGFAQDADGGLSASLTFSEFATVDDDDGFKMRSDLGFDLSSRTRSQTFEMSLRGALDKFGDTDDGFSFEDPEASLLYSIENRTTVLSFDANYISRKVDAFTLSDDLDDGDITLDDARRDDLGAGISMEFGRDEAFGATLSLRYADRSFSDTTSTTLLDSVTQSGNLGFRFEIDPLLTARLTYTYRDLDRDGGTDTETQRLSAGINYQITPSLTADLAIGSSRVEQGGTADPNTNSGYSLDASLVKELPNGSLRGSFETDIDENGRRSTFRVDRNMELPRGTLNFGAGLSEDAETGETKPLYALSYEHELARGSLNASLAQSFTSTSDGDEVLRSRLSLGWQQELSSRSNFNSSVAWNVSEQQNGSDSDRSQFDFTVRYNHELSDRWSASAGYQYQRISEDNAEDDTSNEFFIGLTTSVNWRP